MHHRSFPFFPRLPCAQRPAPATQNRPTPAPLPGTQALVERPRPGTRHFLPPARRSSMCCATTWSPCYGTAAAQRSRRSRRRGRPPGQPAAAPGRRGTRPAGCTPEGRPPRPTLRSWPAPPRCTIRRTQRCSSSSSSFRGVCPAPPRLRWLREGWRRAGRRARRRGCRRCRRGTRLRGIHSSTTLATHPRCPAAPRRGHTAPTTTPPTTRTR